MESKTERTELLEKLFRVARDYELKLVSHRCDKGLGRLKLPTEEEMVGCDPTDQDDPRMKKLSEVCQRSNEVNEAERDLIAALGALDANFKDDFFKVTTMGKCQALREFKEKSGG